MRREKQIIRNSRSHIKILGTRRVIWSQFHTENPPLLAVLRSNPRTTLLQAKSVPGGWGSQISRQSTHESGNVDSLTHRPPLPQEILLVLISVRNWDDPRAIVQPEGLGQRKIRMTPSGIESVPYRLVVQCLNQLRHRVPSVLCNGTKLLSTYE